MGVEHPDNGEYALMCNSADSNCNMFYQLRHLKEWDIDCVRRVSEERTVEPGYQIMDTNGQIGGYYTPMFYEKEIDKFGVGRDEVGFNFAYLLNRSESKTTGEGFWILWEDWETNHVQLDRSTYSNYSRIDSIGPTVAHFPAYSYAKSFFIWATFQDRVEGPICNGPYDACPGHHLYQSNSDDGFETANSEPLYSCAAYSVSNPYNCNYAEDFPISVYRKPWTTTYPGRPAFTMFIIGGGTIFYPEIAKTTLVAHMTVGATMITIGAEEVGGNIVLGHPNYLPESIVAPAIACSEDGTCENGAYHCLMAYVPPDDDDGRIHFLPFNIHHVVSGTTPYKYEISADPNGPYRSGYYYFQTAGDLALWNTDGRYYLALKRDNWWQYTKIYSAPECVDNPGWTYEHQMPVHMVGGLDVGVMDNGEARLGFVQDATWDW